MSHDDGVERLPCLLKVGHSVNKIFRLFPQLKITKRFVERKKQHFDKAGDVVDSPRAGQQRTTWMKKAVEAVCFRINRNPCRKQKLLSQLYTYRQIDENTRKCWRNERNEKCIDGIS